MKRKYSNHSIRFLMSLFLLLAFMQCRKEEDKLVDKQEIHVTLKNTEDYSYDLGSFGDEEGATISRQATHYQVSALTREDKYVTFMYRYKPAPDFTGIDEVEIKSAKGSDGESPNNIIVFTTIKFTVTD